MISIDKCYHFERMTAGVCVTHYLHKNYNLLITLHAVIVIYCDKYICRKVLMHLLAVEYENLKKQRINLAFGTSCWCVYEILKIAFISLYLALKYKSLTILNFYLQLNELHNITWACAELQTWMHRRQSTFPAERGPVAYFQIRHVWLVMFSDPRVVGW